MITSTNKSPPPLPPMPQQPPPLPPMPQLPQLQHQSQPQSPQQQQQQQLPLPQPPPLPPPPQQQHHISPPPSVIAVNNDVELRNENEISTNNNDWSTMKIILNKSKGAVDQQQDSNQNTIVHDSSLSIYERLRHFLYINFVLNKRSFILSILSYLADMILFISLNLYLFSNKKFIYELTCLYLTTTTPSTTSPPLLTSNLINQTTNLLSNTSLEVLNNSPNLSMLNENEQQMIAMQQMQEPSKTIKQSYLSLQIIIIFVFFICFILSYLIKLQFKYHRLALNLYDYDVENVNQEKDRDGLDSLASTSSHFSSSVNKKVSSILKRLLNRLFTKLASILLNFFFGYQFCQNCFIQQPNEISSDGAYSIFIHMFIMSCVVFRSLIIFLNKKNSMNQLNHLKKLQQKQKDLFDPTNNKSQHRQYYYYYYSYLIKSNQNTCNQLKQHQNNQNTFGIFQLDDVSLFCGFIAALFHLFNFLKAFELVFVFLPLLLTLILFRFKSLLNAIVNLSLIFTSIMIISSTSSFSSITDISSYYLAKNSPTLTENAINQSSSLSNSSLPKSISQVSLNNSGSIKDCSTYEELHNTQNTLSIINLFSYNLLTFFCFLLTFYFKSLLSIYYCTLTSLERWNISFLCKLSFWRKLSIYISFLVYLIFILACTIALCIKLKYWSFLTLPFYFLLSFFWICFQLLNTINLTHLMNKINDCMLLLNESNSLSNANSFENSSNVSKKSKSSHIYNNNGGLSSANRNSTLSQSSGNNNNNNGNSNSNNLKTKSFKLKKFLQRFLSYDKLNMNEDEMLENNMIFNASNIPIHRILAYKGVRHLGSISYRISLYCFVLTSLLAPFAFYTTSPITIGIYLISLSLNFIWLSLLYQFPKTASGTCIAHAIVAPPLILNIYNAGTLGTTMTSSSLLSSTNPFLSTFSKRYKTVGGSSTNSSNTYTTTTASSGTGTTTNTASSGGVGNSLLYLPFNYQQALTQRCTYILNKIQMFLQFHLIENFGCDFASHGLSKEILEAKLRNFFSKRSPIDGSYYNTYVLYYCGPTSVVTDGLSFVDGNELGIEQIIDIWKKIHWDDGRDDACDGDEAVEAETVENAAVNTGTNNDDELDGPNERNKNIETKKPSQKKKPKPKKNIMNKNSRLIIVLDAENTSKSLQYVKTKINEPNLYIALQSVKYNYNNGGQIKGAAKCKGIENKMILSESKSFTNASKKTNAGPPPGSPQTINGSFFDSYLNIGKFTLDWIKSNCNAYNMNMSTSYENENVTNELDFINQNENFFYNNDLDEENEDEEDNDDDDDDSNESNNEYDIEKHATMNEKQKNKMTNANVKSHHGETTVENSASGSAPAFFYEAKCAFSRYWIDFNFENKNEKALAHDFNQFWNIYYPYFLCKPMLKLINCRIFYLRFNFIKRFVFALRRLKNKLIPMHEFDTGHGFKLFSS